MKNLILSSVVAVSFAALSFTSSSVFADPPSALLPSHAQVAAALKGVVTAGNNGGFGLNMWATVVNRDGEVVTVAFSGNDRGDQWPGSRVISAQKANTANAFSLPGLALSTANLYSAVQPGGGLALYNSAGKLVGAIGVRATPPAPITSLPGKSAMG